MVGSGCSGLICILMVQECRNLKYVYLVHYMISIN